MTLQSDLETAVAKAATDSGLLHDIVHGDATTTVTTENGPIKSVAKALSEIGDTSNQAVKDLTNVTNVDFLAKATAAGLAEMYSKVEEKTAAYVVVEADAGALFRADATAAAFTITLPLISGLANGDGFAVAAIKKDATTNAVTVAASGLDTINGALSFDFSGQWDSATFVVDAQTGTWTIMGIDQIASQDEAEAGADNVKRMTPLRVAQAIAVQASNGELITANTTLAVASSGGDFTTLKAAYDSLSNRRIVYGVTITITIAGEMITETAPIHLDHPDGHAINIRALDTPGTTTITSQASYSGTTRNWTVQYQVADASGISVGDFLIIKDCTSSIAHTAHEGCWEVISVSAPWVSVRNTYQYPNWPIPNGAMTGNLVILKSIIKNAAGGVLIYTMGNTIASFSNLAFVAPATNGVFVSGTVGFRRLYLNQCGLNGSQGGGGGIGGSHLMNLSGGEVFLTGNCALSGCGASGYRALYGNKTYAAYCIFTGNYNQGVSIEQGSYINLDVATLSGNWLQAVNAFNNATVQMSSAEMYDNGQGFGSVVYASDRAVIYAYNSTSFRGSATPAQNFQATNRGYIEATLSYSSGGFTYDYDAWRMGGIRIGSYRGAGSCNPTVNTRGNNEAYIFNA